MSQHKSGPKMTGHLVSGGRQMGRNVRTFYWVLISLCQLDISIRNYLTPHIIPLSSLNLLYTLAWSGIAIECIEVHWK